MPNDSTIQDLLTKFAAARQKQSQVTPKQQQEAANKNIIVGPPDQGLASIVNRLLINPYASTGFGRNVYDTLTGRPSGNMEVIHPWSTSTWPGVTEDLVGNTLGYAGIGSALGRGTAGATNFINNLTLAQQMKNNNISPTMSLSQLANAGHADFVGKTLLSNSTLSPTAQPFTTPSTTYGGRAKALLGYIPAIAAIQTPWEAWKARSLQVHPAAMSPNTSGPVTVIEQPPSKKPKRGTPALPPPPPTSTQLAETDILARALYDPNVRAHLRGISASTPEGVSAANLTLGRAAGPVVNTMVPPPPPASPAVNVSVTPQQPRRSLNPFTWLSGGPDPFVLNSGASFESNRNARNAARSTRFSRLGGGVGAGLGIAGTLADWLAGRGDTTPVSGTPNPEVLDRILNR